MSRITIIMASYFFCTKYMSGILLDRYLLFYGWKYWDLEVKFTRIVNMLVIEQELEAEMSAIFNTVLLTATLVVHNHFF